MELSPPRQWEWLAAVPFVTGLYWLLAETGSGWLIWAFVPGVLLLSSGVALFFALGDHRIMGMMAAGGVIGILLFPLAWIAGDLASAFYTLVGSAGSLLVAGRIGLTREPLYLGAPPPEMSALMDFKSGFDEALLGYFVGTATVPSGDRAERMCDDALRLEAMLQTRGWLADPAQMHPAPPMPDETFVERGRIWGVDYEVLRFDSGFAPPSEFPGADRWLSYQDNAGCHVRILRHPGPPRPWLMCLHGYRMGVPWMDLSLFAPSWLHHGLGLNIIQPVLPLHGPRRTGLRSGDQFLDGDLLDLVYSETQALWDLRRTLAWLRSTEPDARIGVFGISLGGYNAALLSAYEPELDFVIAGIPVIDFAAALWRFLPPAHLRYFASRGIDENHYRRVLGGISPLSRPSLLDKSRLHIFGAAGDRVVLPSHPLALSQHWQVPVEWYQGSHLSLRQERVPRKVLRMAVEGAGWPLR